MFNLQRVEVKNSYILYYPKIKVLVSKAFYEIIYIPLRGKLIS